MSNAVVGRSEPRDKTGHCDSAAARQIHQPVAGPATSVIHSHSTASAADRPEQRERPAPEIGRQQCQRRKNDGRDDAQREIARRQRLPASPAFGTGSASTTGSGSGLGDEPAEPALALPIFADRGFERGAVEIGPIGRHEYQFTIGRLPEQEIRQPLLAAGADNQIGIGKSGASRKRASCIHVDVGRRRDRPRFTSAAMRRAARAISCRAP